MQPPSRRLLDDPHSRHFVRHPLLRAILAHRLSAGAAVRILDRLWGGLHAHIVLRVRYTDDVCDAAMCDGIDQIVLLGAGFDTTSLRKARNTAAIFEVDAPATQSDKRPITERHLPSAECSQTIWVPCDFEEDRLQKQLITYGFDSARPSVIVWLGVSPYLTAGAIDHVLTDLETLCAPGSRLVVDYIDAGVVDATTPWKSARRVARAVARRGEPYRSGFTEAGLEALLASHGFSRRGHETVSSLLQRYDPAHLSRLAGDDWLAITTAEKN